MLIHFVTTCVHVIALHVVNSL